MSGNYYSADECAWRTTLSRPMSINDSSRYGHDLIGRPAPKPALPSTAPPPPDTLAVLANKTIADTEKRFRQHLAGIHRGDHSDDGHFKAVRSFDTTGIDDAVAQVRQRAEDAAQEVSRIRRGLSPDGDVAGELRATRYWNRTAHALDTAEPGRLITAARNLVADADRAELGTLLQELGPYLSSRKQPTDWIDDVVADKVPEYASARKKLVKARQSATIVESNARALRNAVDRAHEGYRSPQFVAVDRYDPDA